jgi:hypothetical protein
MKLVSGAGRSVGRIRSGSVAAAVPPVDATTGGSVRDSLGAITLALSLVW